MSEQRKTESQSSSPAVPDRSAEVSQHAAWIAEVSHELRLPIANVRLLVETLLDGALDDRDVARRMLERTKQEIDRLQSLVSDLLSVEKLAETDEIKRQWVLLEAQARYAIDSTAALAKANRVTVQLAIEPGFVIHANPEQLDQVLLNLLENAIKFTPPGGKVTLRSLSPGCFAVEDTGIGMPENEIPKIFNRFYRIDRSRARGSTGLGLSIVKNILDLHGAKISVSSREGVGSTFTLDFSSPRTA
ncbi:MAG TPA: HAMP domain-containing sensor histidine kinase [Candidatus Obscuribacterales bacterium]